MLERRPALGKGLSALIPDAPEPIRTGTIEVDIDLLTPNEHQPRLTMDDARLEELAHSVTGLMHSGHCSAPMVITPLSVSGVHKCELLLKAR